MYSLLKPVEEIEINGLNYESFTLQLVSNGKPGMNELYYFTVWNNTLFTFLYDYDPEDDPQLIRDTVASFNPKGKAEETSKFIDSYLNDPAVALPNFKVPVETNLPIQYVNYHGMHMLCGPKWIVAIDGRYTIEDSDYTSFSMPDTNNWILFNRYPIGDVSIEAAANTIFDKNYNLEPSADKTVIKEMTTETIGNVLYYAYSYQATDPNIGKLYTFTYITQWENFILEFTCISDSSTPPREFIGTLQAFQPRA